MRGASVMTIDGMNGGTVRGGEISGGAVATLTNITGTLTALYVKSSSTASLDSYSGTLNGLRVGGLSNFSANSSASSIRGIIVDGGSSWITDNAPASSSFRYSTIEASSAVNGDATTGGGFQGMRLATGATINMANHDGTVFDSEIRAQHILTISKNIATAYTSARLAGVGITTPPNGGNQTDVRVND